MSALPKCDCSTFESFLLFAVTSTLLVTIMDHRPAMSVDAAPILILIVFLVARVLNPALVGAVVDSSSTRVGQTRQTRMECCFRFERRYRMSVPCENGWSVLLRRMQYLAAIPVLSRGCGCPHERQTSVRNLRRIFFASAKLSFEFVKRALGKNSSLYQFAGG
jgi:hypothetical protein